MKMADSSPERLKARWEKEKLLVASNFSFSHSLFKRLVLQTRKKKGLFWKGLTRAARDANGSSLVYIKNIYVSKLNVAQTIGLRYGRMVEAIVG